MFCKNCGKVLGLNPAGTCPDCGDFVYFCRNCGKGLTLSPDKTCANCGANPVKSTAFCRYCGKPTGPQDKNCPACGAFIVTVQGGFKPSSKKRKRIVMAAHAAVLVIAVGVFFALPAKAKEPVYSWISTLKAPPVKVDTSKNVTIDLVYQDGKFIPDQIYAEAGANLIINFTNKDVGVQHNFVLYHDVEQNWAQMFSTAHVKGPGTAVYKIKVPKAAPDGTYWFCSDENYGTKQGFLYPTWPAP